MRVSTVAAAGLLLAASIMCVAGDDASLLCACSGIVWTVKPQGNKITDDIHLANVRAMNAAEAGKGLELVFYGDSITQHMSEDSNVAAFIKHWGKYKSLSMGVGNDRTYNLFWRLQNGELPQTPLKVAVFLIGTNDIGYTDECTRSEKDDNLAVPSMNSRMQHLFDWFSQQLPSTHVVLLGILPRGSWTLDVQSSWPNRLTSTIAAVNANLQAMAAADPLRHYIDCGAFSLMNGAGPINTALLPDSLHPNLDGYDELYSCLAPLVDRLMVASNASISSAAVPQTNEASLVPSDIVKTLPNSAVVRSQPRLTEAEAVSQVQQQHLTLPWTNLERMSTARKALGLSSDDAQPTTTRSVEGAVSGASLRAQPFAGSAPGRTTNTASTPPTANSIWQGILNIVDSLPNRPANSSDPNDICLRTPLTIARNQVAAAFAERMAASSLLNTRNNPYPGCDFCKVP